MEFVVCPMQLYPHPIAGTERLNYRAKVYLYSSDFDLIIRADPASGVPIAPWALVRVHTWLNRQGAVSDPEFTFVPPDSLGTTLGNRANQLENALSSKFGIVVDFTASTTIREALNTVGRQLDPAFDADTLMGG